jgi:hypothetical protein
MVDLRGSGTSAEGDRLAPRIISRAGNVRVIIRFSGLCFGRNDERVIHRPVVVAKPDIDARTDPKPAESPSILFQNIVRRKII